MRSFLLNQPPINLGTGGQNRALYQFTMQDADTANCAVGAGARAADPSDARLRGRELCSSITAGHS